MHRSVVTVFLAALVAAPAVAAAQRPHPPHPPRAPHAPHEGQAAAGEEAPPAPTLADLATIVPKLHSANADEVREAIDLLTVMDRPEAVAPLAELLRSGQTDAITDRTLEALGALAQPQGIGILVEFTHHRRESARRRAYQSLAAIHDNRIPRLVVQGLHDSDRTVRGACALALGDIGARDQVDTLFTAFDRGVIEAAIAIGKLGDAHAVDRFSESLGHQALSVMLSGYEQFVRRRDLAEDVKVKIVTALGEVSGGMVKSFLQDLDSTFSQRDRSVLRRRVEETINRIPDSAPSAPPAPPAPPPAAAAPAGGAR